MTIDQAVAAFEAGRTVVEGCPRATAQTGEPYVAVGSGGRKREGDAVSFLYSSPEPAIAAWLAAANEYAAGKVGTLFWRTRPELVKERAGNAAFSHLTVYAVYSRLLISDRPPIDPALLAWGCAPDCPCAARAKDAA